MTRVTRVTRETREWISARDLTGRDEGAARQPHSHSRRLQRPLVSLVPLVSLAPLVILVSLVTLVTGFPRNFVA